ncbi:30S ribosomal protein S8 [Candidatus Kaiserbacteria bacterium]|nr:30S ribosomal protein S8 [Candidatus Kaiserbacteria bacterium]
MVSDTVGDFIIQLKNAGMAGNEIVMLPYSKLKAAIADRLVKEGYIISAEKIDKKVGAILKVTLKYVDGGRHQINGVKRISKPGRRLYIKAADIYPVKFGRGSMILSTPAGILTGEEARKQQVGGEQLFIIW